MSEPESKRLRNDTDSKEETLVGHKQEEEDSSLSTNLTYLAFHPSPSDGEITAIEWALYRNKTELKQGVSSVDDHAGFVDGLRFVLQGEDEDKDGFVVSFGLNKPLMVWFREVLSNDEEYELWKKVKKFNLGKLDLFSLVDEECYEFWSLSRLHSEMYGNIGQEDKKTRSNAILVGAAFYWFATRHETKVKPIHFTGAMENCFIRNSNIGFYISNQKRIARASWLRSGQHWDSPSSTIQQKPKRIQYIVVDVETHDWLKQPNRRETAIGRIVEIAWIGYDASGKEVDVKHYLLKPHGYEDISRKATLYHGISNRMARERGSDAGLVFAEFSSLLQQIPEDGFVIAHNMCHEDAILFTNLDKAGDRQIWDKAPKCDTMAKPLLKLLPRENYNLYQGRKYGVKLTELHHLVCPARQRLESEHHSALSDVRMAWDIFDYYRKAVASREVWKVVQNGLLEWKQPVPAISRNEPGFGGGGSANRAGRTPLQAQGGRGGDLKDSLFQYVQQNAESTELGVNIQDCIQSHPQASETDIRNVIENLQSEGMIYSTVNEDHFKCAM